MPWLALWLALVLIFAIAIKLACPTVLSLLLYRRLARSSYVRAIRSAQMHVSILPLGALVIRLSDIEVSASTARRLNDFALGLLLPSELSSLHLAELKT